MSNQQAICIYPLAPCGPPGCGGPCMSTSPPAPCMSSGSSALSSDCLTSYSASDYQYTIGLLNDLLPITWAVASTSGLQLRQSGLSTPAKHSNVEQSTAKHASEASTAQKTQQRQQAQQAQQAQEASTGTKASKAKRSKAKQIKAKKSKASTQASKQASKQAR